MKVAESEKSPAELLRVTPSGGLLKVFPGVVFNFKLSIHFQTSPVLTYSMSEQNKLLYFDFIC